MPRPPISVTLVSVGAALALLLGACGEPEEGPATTAEAAPAKACPRGRPGCVCNEDWGTDTARECDPGATCYFGYCWAVDAVPTDSYLYTARYAEDPVLIKREIVDWLHVRPGDHVADLGAGHGGLTFQLASRVGRGGKVYATDISRSALETLARSAGRAGGPVETRFATHRRDDALAGVAPGELALAIMVNSVQFRTAEYPRETEVAYLAGIARLLAPDGELLYHQDWLWPAQLGRDELVALFAEAGLRVASELPLPEHIPPTAIVHYPDGSQPDVTVRRGFTLVLRPSVRR